METLVAKALSLFDRGIKTFLSDPTTRQGINGSSRFDPIEDRDALALICAEHPEANLEVVLGQLVEVMALEVGVGSKATASEEAFRKLCEKHGVPDTVSCAGVTGGRYYFFKYDYTVGFPDETGLKIFSDVEGLLIHPLKFSDGLVDEIGPGMAIQDIWEWLGGASKAVEDVTQDEGLLGVTEVAVPETTAGPSYEEQLSDEESSPETDQTADDAQGPVPDIILDPVALLRNEILSCVAGGGDKPAILAKALDWNRANGEPLRIAEIVTAVEELTASSTADVSPLTARDMLFKLADDMTLFSDDQSKPYFFYEGEAFSAPSTDVKNRLTHYYLKEMEDLPPKKELNAVLDILKSRARFDGPRISLFNRVGKSGDAILYDLRDKRYVQVSPKGWEIVPSFPLFRRYQHLQPQTVPLTGGDPWEVFNFLTVPKESRLLIMSYLISLFVPKIAHPVLAVCGDQGSSKSFFCSVINRLVDPTLTERVIQPKNERDLIQTLRQKYVTVLDNLSKIDNRVSDIFCQVCTGGSVSYRELYTNEGENIAQFRHVVILNSINLAIVNADLMDRSIILKLRRIEKVDRKPEHDLWEAFEASRASILGGIFDIVAKAMAIYPTVKVEQLPRLADFAKWGYAIAEALGKSGDQFLADFTQNVKRQNESVVEKNVLCQAVLTLMAEGKPFLAKVGDAHETLKSIAKQDAKDETFPKLPHLMRAALDRLRASLLEHGISYEYLDRQGAGVKILISKAASPDTPQQSSPEVVAAKVASNEPDEPDVAESEMLVFEMDEMPGAVYE
ncbi:hypothetical protein [Geoanaerobacter pelophilus]|uniref:hypothetical protein n=1 Tax=Geoanaerobacter pelophilus TaxID=60036 RepID=UPI000A26F3D1|nr:hypothetical protein [Geoanaerobacter pelophilus]